MKKNIAFTILSIILILSCSTQNSLISDKKISKPTIIQDTIASKKVQPIFTFPDVLNENSGLEIQDNFIWTFNDSGGKNGIYKVDFKGNIKQEVIIGNSKNIDWEDITSDDNYIYIGDFGNNNGNRQDLKIYRISKKQITSAPKQQVNAEIIQFEYKYRTDFTKKAYDHDFDCESMFIYQNEIHLLTKAWKTGISSHYVLPKTPGYYKAQLLERYDTKGFLTAADINNKEVSTVQYKRSGEVMLSTFTFDKNGLLFNNPVHRTYLGNTAQLGQIEGLTFFQNKTYISGEEMDDIAPILYYIQK